MKTNQILALLPSMAPSPVSRSLNNMLLPVFAACSESEGNTDTPAGGSQTAFDPSAAMEKNLKSV